MRLKKIIFVAGAALLVGAGCAKQPATTTKSETQDRSRSAAELTVPTAPPPTQSQSPAMEKTWSFPGVLPENQIKDRQIRMQTSKGEIVFELFEEESPKAVSNLIYLVKGGFYDGIKFHRRVEGFVIQGGDPLTRDDGKSDFWGTGGPGYRFEDEPAKRAYDRGIVAMANAGKDTNGSQFFIMLADVPLDPLYTVLGRVTKGMDVVDKIQVGDAMTSVMVEAKSK